MWQPTDVMTLFWCDTNLGTVTNLVGDQPWIPGDFVPTRAASEFREFFDACVSEDDPPPDIEELFDPALLDEENWFVVTQDGTRVGISLPALHWDTADVTWRWR